MKRNKIVFTVSSLLMTISLFMTTAYAQNINYKIPNPSKYDSLEEIISAVGSLIRPAFLLTFGAMIIVGAFYMMTSKGDEEKVMTAKKTITAAIIGFLIAALAPTIANFVTNLLGVEGFS